MLESSAYLITNIPLHWGPLSSNDQLTHHLGLADYRETAAKLQKEWRVEAPHRQFSFAPHVKNYALVDVLNKGLIYGGLVRDFENAQVSIIRFLSLFAWPAWFLSLSNPIRPIFSGPPRVLAPPFDRLFRAKPLMRPH